MTRVNGNSSVSGVTAQMAFIAMLHALIVLFIPSVAAAGQLGGQTSDDSPSATAAEATNPAPAQLSPVPQDAAAPNVAPSNADVSQPVPTVSTPEPSTTPSSYAAPTAASPPAIKSPLAHDLSPWGMFLAADIVVKSVMVGLAFASVITWTVWIAKSLELSVARRSLKRSVALLRQTSTLAEAWQKTASQNRLSAALMEQAQLELRLSADILDKSGTLDRVGSRLQGVASAAGRAMNRGTGVIASIGSTAPFVGLFGTVWGIMNSFIGISKSQTTNLAVVAPGIAEALLATGLGLVAAIPAVIVYNQFSRSISAYKALMGEASAEVLRHVSRDLDRGMRFQPAQAAAE